MSAVSGGIHAPLTLLVLAFGALFFTASQDAWTRPAWEIDVDRVASGTPRVRVQRDDQRSKLRTPPPLAREVAARTDGASLVIEAPAAMRVTASDWQLKLSFERSARDAELAGFSVEVDGVVVADGLAAGRKRTVPLPLSAFGEGPFEIRVLGPQPGAVDSVTVRNHGSFRAWFPTFTVLRASGLPLRPFGDAIPFGGVLLLLAAAGAGLARGSAARGAVALSPRQAWGLALPWAIAALGLGAWNALSGSPLVFGQGSLVAGFVGVVLGVAIACAMRNVEAARSVPRSAVAAERRADRRRAIAIGLALFAIYNSNGARVGMVDGLPPPQMAISLLREGDLDLDEYRASYTDSQARVGLVETAEHWVTRWAPGTALFCLPVFAIPTWLGVDAPSVSVDILAKLTASGFTALSMAMLFVALRFVASRGAATWWTVAGALGTAVFHVNAQDTWAHGPFGFALALVLAVALSDTKAWRWHAVAGLFIGLAVASRPQGAVVVAPLLAWLAWRHGIAIAVPYALGGALPAAFLLGFNQHYFGTLSFTHYAEIFGGGWDLPGMPEGLLGQLVSPNRGLLVFSPFLLFAGFGAWVGWREGDRDRRLLIVAALAAIAAHLLLLSAWRAWHAIFSYGSRYGADLVPWLALLGVLGTEALRRRRVAWRAFQASVALSIGIHALAVYWDLWAWNEWVERERGVRVSDFKAAAWETSDPQIWYQLRLALGWLDD